MVYCSPVYVHAPEEFYQHTCLISNKYLFQDGCIITNIILTHCNNAGPIKKKHIGEYYEKVFTVCYGSAYQLFN